MCQVLCQSLFLSCRNLNFTAIAMPPAPPDPIYIFSKNMAQINYMFINLENGNELLYVGTEEGLIHIWDLKIKREVKSIKVSDAGCLTIVRCNDIYITQEKGGCLKYWKVENEDWNLVKTIQLNYHGFCKILTFNGKVFCPIDDGIVNILNGNQKTKVQFNDKNKRGEVMCMKYLEQCHLLLIMYEDGTLALWAFNDNVLRIQQEVKFDDTPMCIEVCEFSMLCVLGGSSEYLRQFSIENNRISNIRSTTITNPGISSIALSKDGKLVVAGCWDGRIRYFSMKKFKLLVVLEHAQDPIQYVMFSEQSLASCSIGTIFAAGKDGRISLWDLYTKRNLEVT